MKYDVKLVKLPLKVLRKKSKEVPIPLKQEDIELAEKMIWHITDSQKPNTQFQPGVGVAAVQYGILKRMFYIKTYNEGEKYANKDGKTNYIDDVLINPKIIATSDYNVALHNGEGCLSVAMKWPNQEGYVYRKNRIVFEAYSYREKKTKKFDLQGYLAIVAQHELDHLDGKLFVDHINTKNPWYDKNNSRIIKEGEN
ncbi:peptide deformylase [Mycoplasmopsis lipofaciens]|uniref:peptide deformylase n=1 Tax=Mycoplasmopsis lipofaciens TaxID=114884 RepID=UPI000488E01D|nr:peptide deformylase [Mycoplasmopsis lipofaciens]